MENFDGGSAVFPKLRHGLKIELSDFERESVTLKVDFLRQIVEIEMGGVPIVIEVKCMSLFMTLSRIL